MSSNKTTRGCKYVYDKDYGDLKVFFKSGVPSTGHGINEDLLIFINNSNDNDIVGFMLENVFTPWQAKGIADAVGELYKTNKLNKDSLLEVIENKRGDYSHVLL